MAPTESCSHKEALPTDCLNISCEVTPCGLWRRMSSLDRCPCLVITGLHLLPEVCGSSSIATFAASPPSSCNEAGKSARDDVCTPTARWKRTKGSKSDGNGWSRREGVNVSLDVIYLQPSCQTTCFIYIPSKPSIPKSPKKIRMVMRWKKTQ